ncbi:MAG TPA: alpha/beta fold hydrolase [Burkholderiales bacterium]|nr:alpha/beta fold hydrolase [Burkholderiales bacterium]
MRRPPLYFFVLLGLILTSLDALAQLAERKVDIYSEGVRMTGSVLYAQPLEGKKLPAIILSHGWGGTAAMLHPQAERFAQAGYFVLVFDYRGWGESDSRWVRDESATSAANARRELREVVDPLDQAADIFSAVHWVMGEPMVDVNRVGLWGTSFSGGLVAYVAARDPRIKAIVSQVGAFGRPRASMPPDALSRAQSDATRRARGDIGYPAPGVREIGNLRGAPVRESFLRYAPIADISMIKGCAMLIIDAEKEELFDIREHGGLAFERAAEPKKRVVIPGTHYGIYTTAREQSIDLAIDWMDQHLKGAM